MTRSAKPSWRPRGAAGFSANMPSATAMPTPAWCSMRWRGSKKILPPSDHRPPKAGSRKRWPRSASAVDEARTAATAAVDSPVVEENLAPVRKGARIIREIAWRWREIGADSRICDLLDSQVSAIEGACEQIASNSPLDALSAAFDLIEARIAEFGDSGAAAPRPAEEANPSPVPGRRNARRRTGAVRRDETAIGAEAHVTSAEDEPKRRRGGRRKPLSDSRGRDDDVTTEALRPKPQMPMTNRCWI